MLCDSLIICVNFRVGTNKDDQNNLYFQARPIEAQFKK